MIIVSTSPYSPVSAAGRVIFFIKIFPLKEILVIFE
jgi:hypothetical protein